MKKQTFIGIFITVQIACITLYIHKQSLFVKLSYQKQTAQDELKKLIAHKEVLTSKLCDLQNPKRVKHFAQEKLGMQPLALKKIKRLPVC